MPYQRKTILEKNQEFDPNDTDPEVREIYDRLSSMVNVMHPSAAHDLAMFLVRDHRTLQQGMMRELVWPLLQLWAEDYNSGRFDDRNEDTVRFAFNIVSTFSNPSPGFRFI